ncbi:MAG: hypothetical protein DLM56_01385 [Pseudonocardiales bacterium]|nr:MAG: hypothetical protein DLM56_01385 [Pseudonocardiales bacterium]
MAALRSTIWKPSLGEECESSVQVPFGQPAGGGASCWRGGGGCGERVVGVVDVGEDGRVVGVVGDVGETGGTDDDVDAEDG